MQVDYYSDALCRGTQLELLLPTEPAPEPGYPVLWLLHGMTDDQSAWLRYTGIERYAQARSMAVVMPCGYLGWYADAGAGARYFEYVAQEAPDFCRRMLPRLSRRREDNFIAGNSMGGYGALRCALAFPERFCAAATLSGALDAAALPSLTPPLAASDFWRDVFGPEDAISGSDHDLFAAAERCAGPRPRIWMWCGTEDFLYAHSLRMRDHLRRLGYEMRYQESPGDHQWAYWDREIARAVDWFAGKEGNVTWP